MHLFPRSHTHNPKRIILSTNHQAGKNLGKHNYHQTTPSPLLHREFLLLFIATVIHLTEPSCSDTSRFISFILLQQTKLWRRARKTKQNFEERLKCFVICLKRANEKCNKRKTSASLRTLYLKCMFHRAVLHIRSFQQTLKKTVIFYTKSRKLKRSPRKLKCHLLKLIERT